VSIAFTTARGSALSSACFGWAAVTSQHRRSHSQRALRHQRKNTIESCIVRQRRQVGTIGLDILYGRHARSAFDSVSIIFASFLLISAALASQGVGRRVKIAGCRRRAISNTKFVAVWFGRPATEEATAAKSFGKR